MRQVFRCKCGLTFSARLELLQHVALGNSKWPRAEQGDEHGEGEAGPRYCEPITEENEP